MCDAVECCKGYVDKIHRKEQAVRDLHLQVYLKAEPEPLWTPAREGWNRGQGIISALWLWGGG